MVGVKISNYWMKSRNMKKFYILSIIFLVCSTAVPALSIAATPPFPAHLAILYVSAAPDPAVEGDIVHIYVTIQNIGSSNISVGQQIIITVKIDNEPTIAASLIDTLGLVVNQQRTENLTWTATLGSTQLRLLHITVTYLGVIEAVVEREIQVNQRNTDLLFVATPAISGMSSIGKPVTISALVKNIGANNTQNINVSLYIDRTLSQWYTKSDGLIKGESCGVSFSWTPLTFGVHIINLTIDPNHIISEQLKSNNYYETAKSMIPWWNTSWHYRRIYNVTGSGNLSTVMNFTAILHSLQVQNKTFDNNSITIVRYYTNGTMVVVNTTWFNESSVFHNRTNAVGTLTWNVAGSSLYGVYFDVTENRGTRAPISETLNLTQSGSVHASIVVTEGWWPEFVHSFQTYYLLNTTLLVQVFTTALAKNVTAHFLLENHAEFTMPLQTLNNINWSNTSKKLSKKGNWTVQVIGYDDAGYQAAPLIIGFYIGKPDLAVTALSAPDVCYVDYNVSVVAHVRAFNATVEHVNVVLRVDNINTYTLADLTFQKDENRTLQFPWQPAKKGDHNVSVSIVFSDSNPWNNKRWKWVTVEGIPDMAVLNITVEPTPVNEGSPVAVTAYISNTGDGNASDYVVVLYCEQNENNHTMYYYADRNATTVSLQKNHSTNITLLWEQTKYGKASFKGEWAVGIQILNTTQTPDKHGANNYKALFHVLRVTPAERTPPVLSNLEYSSTIEQGNTLLIRVKATDASGIGTVSISIKTPNKTMVNATMTERESNRYEYLFNAVQVGRHNFTIKATDLSPNKNQSTITGYFEVTEDKTPPSITYAGVNPFVQLPQGQVEIRCIATDFSGVHFAEVSIRFPNNLSESHVMNNIPSDTKYLYTRSYDSIGKYVFTITVEDNKGNKITTPEKSFWITDDLNDTDSDGMPDDWELRYGFNPYDSHDASLDSDNDGVTNLQEYQQGTNPLQSISTSELVDRLQENWAYLTASIIVFLIIVMLAWFGIRRRSQ
jgi:hypothetical protein